MSVRLSGSGPGSPARSVDTGLLERRAEAVLGALACPDAELSITLADDAEIAELNRSFRDRAGPTDVLSFSLLEGEHADFRGGLLGDVVLGVEVAARQAEERGASLDEELARLLIHGVLHLLGHDHQAPDEARRMRSEERRLWRVIAP